MTSETPRTDAAKIIGFESHDGGGVTHNVMPSLVVPVATAEQLEREATHYKKLCEDMLDAGIGHINGGLMRDFARRYNEGPRAGGEKGEDTLPDLTQEVDRWRCNWNTEYDQHSATLLALKQILETALARRDSLSAKEGQR